MAKSTRMDQRNDEWPTQEGRSKNEHQKAEPPAPRRGEYNWRQEGHGTGR